MPDVSVVLPVFNAAGTVERAVHSILGQSFRPLELIVVDDGSSDGTADVVRAMNEPLVRLVQFPHRGVAATANAATELARAPFIARMDADDVSHPQRLMRQLELLQEKKLDVVGCQVRILDESRRTAPTMRRYEEWINEETSDGHRIRALRFVEFPLVNPTILARRSYFEMGFRSGDFPEDYDLMLRAAASGMRFGKVDEVLFDWTDGPRRLTRSDPRYTTAAFDRCRRMHLLAGPLRGLRRIDLWGVGQTGKGWLRWLLAQGIDVRRGYDVNERKIGARIHGVRIAHPDEMPEADGTPLLIAVGAEGARQLIWPHVLSRRYVVGDDAWFVA